MLLQLTVQEVGTDHLKARNEEVPSELQRLNKNKSRAVDVLLGPIVESLEQLVVYITVPLQMKGPLFQY